MGMMEFITGRVNEDTALAGYDRQAIEFINYAAKNLDPLYLRAKGSTGEAQSRFYTASITWAGKVQTFLGNHGGSLTPNVLYALGAEFDKQNNWRNQFPGANLEDEGVLGMKDLGKEIGKQAESMAGFGLDFGNIALPLVIAVVAGLIVFKLK